MYEVRRSSEVAKCSHSDWSGVGDRGKAKRQRTPYKTRPTGLTGFTGFGLAGRDLDRTSAGDRDGPDNSI